MAPFQPVGDRARWRVILELLQATETGGTLTYKQLAEALELDPDDDRHTIQMAVRRAAREHEEVDKRSIDVVPNTGYIVVQTPEKLRLARDKQKRAGKSLARGQSHVVNVDLEDVDPDTRNAFEVVARAFAMQMDYNRRLDVRQAKLEETVDAMSQRTERTEAEVAELKARLARLEGDSTPT
jgi:hypothetical protein